MASELLHTDPPGGGWGMFGIRVHVLNNMSMNSKHIPFTFVSKSCRPEAALIIRENGCPFLPRLSEVRERMNGLRASNRAVPADNGK